MEYFNKFDDTYDSALKSRVIRYTYIIQTLDHWENTIREITTDFIPSDSSVSVNLSQGSRRSAILKILNTDGSYTPSADSDFWFNRKFRVLCGIKAGSDIYLRSLGVFVTASAESEDKTLAVKGVDKYGNLNGETGIGVCSQSVITDIASGGIYVAELIRQTLMTDMGNGMPIDPVPPKIDPVFEETALYRDITLDSGQYYGEIITQLADMYGANVFYDKDGALVFTRKTVSNIPSWYEHSGHIWEFDSSKMSGVTSNYDLSCVNAVTVTTDNTSGEIYSYTAENRNAESPVNVKAVGLHYGEQVPVYISLGDTSISTGEEKCKEYAEYLLFQNTLNGVTESFDYPLIPHMDVDEVVGFDEKDYLVNQIDFDLGAMKMSLKLCNVNFLPNNHSMISYE